MTAPEKTKHADLRAPDHGVPIEGRGEAIGAPGRDRPADGLADPGKVIPFARGRRHDPGQESAGDRTVDTAAPAVIGPEARPLPAGALAAERGPLLAFLTLSVVVHAGALMMLNREPEPMASTGLDAISVEIVLGANAPPAPALQPDDAKTARAPDPNPAPPPSEPDTPPVRADTPPEPTPQQPVPEPQQTPVEAAAPANEMTAPQDAVPAPPPVVPVAPPQPEHPALAHTPVMTDRHPPQRPEERHKPAEGKKVAALPTDRGSPPSHSAADANYRGLVAAHLQRYKPSGRNEQGSVVVSFTLDGSGRVTRVALTHGSGVPALDQDAQAMVHRASPFPSPPDGRPISFTVPVNFHPR